MKRAKYEFGVTTLEERLKQPYVEHYLYTFRNGNLKAHGKIKINDAYVNIEDETPLEDYGDHMTSPYELSREEAYEEWIAWLKRRQQ
jgi:hypothetical protein